MENNRKGKLSLDMNLMDEQDELIKDLMMRMLEVDNGKRISAKEALRHCLFYQTENSPTTATIQIGNANNFS